MAKMASVRSACHDCVVFDRSTEVGAAGQKRVETRHTSTRATKAPAQGTAAAAAAVARLARQDSFGLVGPRIALLPSSSFDSHSQNSASSSFVSSLNGRPIRSANKQQFSQRGQCRPAPADGNPFLCQCRRESVRANLLALCAFVRFRRALVVSVCVRA